ncbi:MAG: hypothetical protein KF773_20975 [Deltaproteobacteria bacterium]|nr:hypothetical protein [Deltaproteobacteria bacterium]
MVKSILICVLVVGCVAPGKKNPISCFDRKCDDPARPYCDFDGSVAGQPNTCIAVECTPNAFETCRADDSAAVCNAAGNNFDVRPCDFGCDDTAGCKVCSPNTISCDGDVLRRCDAVAVPTSETCAGGCVDGGTPHCAHVVPKYVPDICESDAVMPELVITNSATFDTGLDSNCTGGVVVQPSAPEICVAHYGRIEIPAGKTLTVRGTRVVAFVADTNIRISGDLDLSADGGRGGAGGGRLSGGQALLASGGGGAGFKTVGGAGGNGTTDGGANNRGSASDPLLLAPLLGGFNNSGGAGGAGTLIACRGSVIVDGLVDAGGGGGGGGAFDAALMAFRGGGGGGSGGYVVFQGLTVEVTGSVFANGGGGGGGFGPGMMMSRGGEDGSRSATTCALGGGPLADEGVGGKGGCTAGTPGNGTRPAGSGKTAGGGGGSMGFFQTYTPTPAASILTPVAASPSFEPVLTIPTR